MSYALVGEFKVTGARNRGNKPNPHGGELTKWYVDLEDEHGNPVRNEQGEVADCYWQRKAGSEVSVGDSVYGKVEEGDHGLRFKLEPRPDGGGSTPASSAVGKREWKPESQYDPEKTARIGRAHAQHMSILTLTAMGTFQSVSAEQIGSKIKQWTDFYQQDVDQAAEQAANRAGGSPANPQEGAAPPSAASPSPGSQDKGQEHQWFKRLLEAAHMDPEPAHVLAEFVVEKFSPEQKARAEEGLEDSSSQPDTLAKLAESYEKLEKKSLPSGDPAGDSIPFRRPEYRELFTERERWRF